MHIAIQASDLDAARIDGTRVYIWNLLKHFGGLAPEDVFHIYHRDTFNSELVPSYFPNYDIRAVGSMSAWTQTRFAQEIFKLKPERLWMPIHSIPLALPHGTQTTVTIHDLAFRYFADHFPLKDRIKLNLFTDWAVRRSDRIIAISENTKKDILHFYPEIAPEKIHVVYHGFDADFFREPFDVEEDKLFLSSLALTKQKYLLYVGALQPRKNIPTLVKVFDNLKKDSAFADIRLVLAGEKAWLWEGTLGAVESSAFKKDILLPGKLPFTQIRQLLRNASAFVYPSLYEGFGLPVLEGFASQVPVICAGNSSLPEVGGDAALYFDATSVDELTAHMKRILSDASLSAEYVRRGNERLEHFSWERCARETLEVIRG